MTDSSNSVIGLIDIEDYGLNKLTKELKSAYRKFKSYTYYNNYSAIDRLKLSEFEFKHFCSEDNFEIDNNKVEEYFKNLAKKIMDNELDEFIEDIGVISLPKKMQDKNKKYNLFTNFREDNSVVDKIHYFIDLPVDAHILGVLWILKCGYILDDKLYHNCYSNRLNKNILNRLKGDHIDSSTFLFYPYFKNYESWRDNGLDEVKNILNKKQNAIMISLDLKDYYYSSRINFNYLRKDMCKSKERLDKKKLDKKSLNNLDNNKISEILTNFIENIFKNYHKKFSLDYSDSLNSDDSNNQYMIPLGFLPSLIIANWNLQGLDQVILENIHPNYYGRYADDILIVLPSHEKSESHGNQHIEELDLEKVILKYLTPNPEEPINSIFYKKEEKINECEEKEIIYGIENLPILSLGFEKKYFYEYLEIQSKKFNVYLFKHNGSQAMINKFKKEIDKNTSEFKLLHGIKSTFENLEYDLYRIDYADSINKLNDINDFRLNKFEASKILAHLIDASKYSNNLDKKEIKFKKEITNQIMYAFNSDALSFINLLEKIFSYLYINNEYTTFIKFFKQIRWLIENISIDENSKFNKSLFKLTEKQDVEIENLKNSLRLFLYSSVVRVISLKFDKDVFKVYGELDKLFYNLEFYGFIDDYDISNDFKLFINNFKTFSKFSTLKFLFSSLQNNNLMRFPIQSLDNILIGQDFDKYDLINPKYDKDYGLFNGFSYPRYVKYYEFVLNNINSNIFKKYSNENKYIFNDCDLVNEYDYILKKHHEINWDNSKVPENKDYKLCPFNSEYNADYGDNYKLSVGNDKKDTLLVGLINTQLNSEDSINRIKDNPNLSYKRFDKIKEIINEAIKKNVEFLLMPELYIPYEWIDKIVEVSRNHQMVMVFGVEYIVHEDIVKNYIMVSLPYKTKGRYKSNILTYRLKNHYAPSEINIIQDLNKKFESKSLENHSYILYDWNGIAFAPYCCYEIADIHARSLFKSECDMITVSEFNKDTKYFNSICESLSRDLFCYCITSNTSEYGGTSIIQPSSSEKKYIIQLKGGKDDYIVTHELNIADLKDKRLRSYTADFSDTHFKPHPPGLDKK